LARLSANAKNGGRRFNPWQMIQQLARDRYHPGAIAEITGKLVKMYDQIRGNPYQYINAFRKTVKQNWNEKEAMAIHEEFKRMEPGVLFEYTKGLFGSL
jgi:site-specific DNA-adenine methylase